jgi:hypothetical protein
MFGILSQTRAEEPGSPLIKRDARRPNRLPTFHGFTRHNVPGRRLSAIIGKKRPSAFHDFQRPIMSPSRLPPVPPSALPPLVAAYVKATNGSDLDALLATFADDALVNDQLRNYWGKSAIREWAARDIIGERLTMHVVTVKEHYGHCILTANIDGNYDKRGLPDPLVLTFYFSAHGDQIVQLIILRNQPDF